MREHFKALASALVATAFVLSLAACGVRGELEPPPPKDKDKQQDGSVVLPSDETAA